MVRYSHQRKRSIPLILFAWLVILAGIGTLLFVSPAFRAQAVAIEGNKTVSEDAMRDLVERFFEENAVRLFGLSLLPGDNILRLSVEELERAAKRELPKIERVSVDRGIPPKLKIVVSERSPFAVWCTRQECFWMSRDGVIFEPAPRVSGTVVLSILDERAAQVLGEPRPEISGREGQDIKLGRSPLSEQALEFVAAVDAKFFETTEVRAKEWRVPASSSELVLKTEESWEARFSSERPAERELSVLKKLLDEVVGERRRELSYVDLRDATRLYYRYRSGEESTESRKGGQ